MAADVAGDPQGGSLWICQSLSKIQAALATRQVIVLSRETIRRLLNDLKIRPKSNVKRLPPHPPADRDEQFHYLHQQRAAFAQAGWPFISVDTKKKELVGLFAKPGRQWCRTPTAVNPHDFPSDADGDAIPSGIYDPIQNQGYVAVGHSAATPEFAVDAIAWGWHSLGRTLYPKAPELLIGADGGGRNGYRPRRWKEQLQLKLADALGLTVTVCPYPPGASKCNPIEHRLFSQISRTWAATPLPSYEVILDALHATSTATGLSVQATFFDTVYEKGLTVSDQDMQTLLLEKHAVCPQWNYTIRPRISGN